MTTRATTDTIETRVTGTKVEAAEFRALLRFSTAGSVDDGKSTLIGRLLFDTRQVFSDQLKHVEEASQRRGFGRTELALLTDGLRAEREQGITIDVAYRYFATDKRRFIVADTPGHVQYTRNMVTGASTADAAVILVDARHGLVEQSRRHAFISSELGIQHLIFAVNKMDLVDWSEARFRELEKDILAMTKAFTRSATHVLPVSALNGDNVVTPSTNTPWYAGAALLATLEDLPAVPFANDGALVLPIQWVIRPNSGEAADYRGYAGRIVRGTLSVGEVVHVGPRRIPSKIASLRVAGVETSSAVAGDSVSVTITDEIDTARGDWIVGVDAAPNSARNVHATVAWFSETGLRKNGRYLAKHLTKTFPVRIERVRGRWDMKTLTFEDGDAAINMNDLGEIDLLSAQEIHFEPYAVDRSLGSFILIDESTNETAAAGLLHHQRTSP